MADKKMRYTVGQIAALCGVSRETIKNHRVKGKLRPGKKNALGYREWTRSQVQLYLWQTHRLSLEEVE